MKKKGKSSALFTVIVLVTLFLAFSGFKGFVVGGWEFKSFNDVIKKGLDLQGGVFVLMEIQEDKVTQDQLESTKEHISLRVNKMGVAETIVTTEGERRIRVDIPGAFDSQEIVDSLSKSGNLVFKSPEGEEILTGKDVKKASAVLNQQDGNPVVSLELNDDGQKAFAEATGKYVGQKISVYMDDELLTSPTVQTQITDGSAIITGSTSLEDAKKLAGIINSGALPVTVKAVSVQNVGAQLGATALPNALKAGAIGIGLVFLFMILYYRVPGLLASIALTLYIAITLLIFTEIGVTLTLPGIAALLLTIGMAVDANVLIFERIREELKRGISVKTSVKKGFENALSSIVDSNVTTILAGLILYFLGSGTVKGFAVTLMIGIVVSLFTSLVVTKLLVNLSVDIGLLKKLSNFGVKNTEDDIKTGERQYLKIIEKSKIWLSISLIVILLGCGFLFTKGLNFGIDFKGGTQLTIQLKDGVDKQEVDNIIKTYASDAVTNTINNNQYEVKSGDLNSEKVSSIMTELKEKYDLDENALLAQDEIGASIGKELTQNSLIALFVACIVMLAYIGVRFELKFGIAALVATLHDVLITVSVYAIFGISVNTPFIAAILTIIGYSMNDTIVIFDRIRENSKSMRRANPVEVANVSLTETMTRSINTTMTTLFTIVAVNIFVPTVREFTIPLIIGIVAGAYSSIFVASPTWVYLKNRIGNKKIKTNNKKLQSV
ncbi:protein translocase subunit SecF [Clostridium botulinum]|nr:protein translocase subunit SecF [Clostridium botulinum]NFL58072.1 protein translocase subunit SecF [Clostridium botulinum]NFL60800.1 protein translocase subunit SecF [Clostridium botulinum]NFO66027.1 protein translocase subunit SecF [Clostridium botulinum]